MYLLAPDLRKDYSAFPGIENISGSRLPKRLRSESKEGKTPISTLLVAGHGSTAGMGTLTDITFTIANLTALDEAASFNRAKKKNGPLRCWFTRDANVRFSGCNTQTTAQSMARSVLRKGSTALGTNQSIGTGMRADGTPGMWLGPIHSSGEHLKWRHNALDYYASPAWVTYKGKL